MKNMIAETSNRVEKHTSQASQTRIDRKTRRNVRTRSKNGRASIRRRLRELDREWDIERMIEANASTLALSGTLLGVLVHRWFLALPIAVTGFLLQHAIQGWCPPVPVLRRLGYRTAREIHEERFALKTLRGDFRRVRQGRALSDKALSAARR
jgi:hypothetical protein